MLSEFSREILCIDIFHAEGLLQDTVALRMNLNLKMFCFVTLHFLLSIYPK